MFLKSHSFDWHGAERATPLRLTTDEELDVRGCLRAVTV